MAKVNLPAGNDFCPQTLFAYGTFKEDGQPNFGLFCWLSYCVTDELGVMACIGESKMTLDRIKENRVFSANLITEENLPLADYFGTHSGYDQEKMQIDFAWEQGAVLPVPVLSSSPVSYELEATEILPLNDRQSHLLLCKIRNVRGDAYLADDSLTVAEKMKKAAPVSTTCMTYFDYQGRALGAWGELAGRK